MKLRNVSSKIIGLSCIIMLACAENKSENASLDMTTVAADSIVSANDIVSSSAAVENGKDSSRKFIRTADMKFKVKNVYTATNRIEDIVSREGGFVTYTNLNSSIYRTSDVAISADSSLETTYYRVQNTITLRVPNTRLDTTLRSIAILIDYLDYRTIKAEDVALQILSNKLTQKRLIKHEHRLTDAIDQRGKKLRETTDAEENLYAKQEQADNAVISNLALNDEIAYSTIHLDIYQRQTIKRELISNDRNIDEYQPNFVSKVIDSLKYGWGILEALLLFLTKLWGLFVLALVLYFLVKKYGYLIHSKK